MTDFAYTDEQWDGIADSIADMLDVDTDDTDLIRRGGASLRDLIEIEADMFCARGWLNRREAERQARVAELIALRDDLRDRIVPALDIPIVNTKDMRAASEAFIDRLTHRIDYMQGMDALRLPSVFRITPDEPAGSNAAKTARHEFWEQLLAIWTALGGQDTGAYTARFLIAASTPAFDFVRDDDAYDKDRAIPSQLSVEQWLRRRKAPLRRRNAAR